MAKANVLTGARAKVLIGSKTVGLFTSCTWSVRQDKQPLFILGRHSPAEITPTSQEAVSITLTGYRVVDSGPYKVANATLLKNILDEEDFSVAVLDRQTKKLIFQAVGCRVLGWSSGVVQRGISDIRLEIIGLIGSDEFSKNGDSESNGASSLTD